MAADQPTRGAPAPSRPVIARPARAKPDPRPSRLFIGAGALAAITVIGAGLVRFPVAADGGASTAVGSVAVADVSNTGIVPKAKGRRPVRYVHLKPGQKAPPGAKVIRQAAPTPRVIVQRVAVSAPSTTSSRVAPVRRTVTRTRQSGR